MKKVLFLHSSAELFGSDTVLLNLILGLNKENFYPIVILPFLGPLCEQLDRNRIEYHIIDLPVLRRSLLKISGILIYLKQFIVSFIKLILLVKKEKIDIIHTNTSAVLIGGFISKLFRRPHIWQVMEIIEKPLFIKFLITKTVGIFSTKVFCISDSVRLYFIESNKNRAEKFETLYHGVSLYEYKYSNLNRKKIRDQFNISEDEIVIAFIGRFNSWKGQELFLKAAIKCISNNQFNYLKFYLIGSCFAGQEEYLNQLNNELEKKSEFKNKIFILGFQNNINEWLSAIDIFVLPSKLPEPNSTILIAAMACERPVIGTSIGGTVETIIDKENGFLIREKNVEEMVEKIIILATNKDLRHEYGKKGLLQVKKKFSLNNYINTVIKSYE